MEVPLSYRIHGTWICAYYFTININHPWIIFGILRFRRFFQNFPINPCDLSVKQLMWIDELGGESGGFVGVWSNAVVLEIVSYFAQLDWKFNNLWLFFWSNLWLSIKHSSWLLSFVVGFLSPKQLPWKLIKAVAQRSHKAVACHTATE